MTEADQTWDGRERRSKPRDVTNPEFVLQHILNRLDNIGAKLEANSAKLDAMHIENIGHKAETHAIQQDVDALKRAFPKDDDGHRDYEGHEVYHGKLIRSYKTWQEIWVDVRKKLFGGIAWAIVVFIAWSIWEGIKVKLTQH